MSHANNQAVAFKALHQQGNPLVLANVWDTLSAQTVAALPSCQALATSSAAVARVNGTTDNDLTMDISLRAVKDIAAVAKAFDKPLTVDVQDAYGTQLEHAISALVKLGASGANIEDCDKDAQQMIPKATAASRIERALATAKACNVPDFVINARCDTLAHGGSFQDALQRGKAYLAAGAACVFVIPGPQQKLGRREVEQMVEAFGGRANVGWHPTGPLSVKDITELGAVRISIGPLMQVLTLKALSTEADRLMASNSRI